MDTTQINNSVVNTQYKDVEETQISHQLYENTNKNYETKSLTSVKENGEDIFSPHETYNLKDNQYTSIKSCFTCIEAPHAGANIILETGGFEALWRKELEDIKSTKTSPLEKITIKMHELIAAPVISRRLMNLSQIDIRKYVQNNVERSFLYETDLSILLGDGEQKPIGILNNEISDKYDEKKLLVCPIKKTTIIEDLLKIENILPMMYRSNATWIISRNLFNEIQICLLKNPQSLFGLVRDGINYRLFGRKVMIFDGLNNNKKNIDAILVHPSAYTIIEDPHIDIIENNQNIDLKLIFIKNFGGGITNHKAIVLGMSTDLK
jgi:HK97 family phage major capsid protein